MLEMLENSYKHYIAQSHILPLILSWLAAPRIRVRSDRGGHGTVEVKCWPFVQNHTKKKQQCEINIAVEFKL